MNETATQEPDVELEGSGEPAEVADLAERTRQSHEAMANGGSTEEDLTEEERASLDEQRAQDEEEVPRGKPVEDNAQTALDETEWEDPELEKILSDREVAKGKKGEVIKKFKTLDDLAKEKLDELGLDDGTVLRIGRYRVRKTAVPSRSVAFETEPTSRLTIGVADE